PVEEWCIEIVADIWVLSREQLARGPLDHQRAVVDVGVRTAGLAQDKRCDGRRDGEGGDDGGEMHDALTCREAAPGTQVAQRVRRAEHAARGQEHDVPTGRE